MQASQDTAAISALIPNHQTAISRPVLYLCAVNASRRVRREPSVNARFVARRTKLVPIASVALMSV